METCNKSHTTQRPLTLHTHQSQSLMFASQTQDIKSTSQSLMLQPQQLMSTSNQLLMFINNQLHTSNNNQLMFTHPQLSIINLQSFIKLHSSTQLQSFIKVKEFKVNEKLTLMRFFISQLNQLTLLTLHMLHQVDNCYFIIVSLISLLSYFFSCPKNFVGSCILTI